MSPAPTPRYASVNAAFEAAARTRWGLTFVDAREEERRFTFAELRERASRVAVGLAALGIHPGDRVALVFPTGVEFMDAFFGTLLAGAVPVPLYPPVRLGRMEEYHQGTARMLQVCGARLVLTDKRVRLLLGKAVERARPELGLRLVEELRVSSHGGFASPASPSDLGLIQFSSGSTVDPKPVALTHGALMAQCAALHTLMPERAEEGGLGVSWLPLYHDMGLIGCLLSALYFPGPLVLLPPEAFLVRPALWLRALSRHRGTISAAPNFAYALCLKRVSDAELQGVDLSHWRYALNGAEPVSPQVMDRFAERFAPYGFDRRARLPVYGLSEASLAVTFTQRSDTLRERAVEPLALALRREVVPGDRRIASVGRPVPGFEVEVRSDEGAVLLERRVGRIFARGPSVMREYFGHPEATELALHDGWLDTGDLGFLDDGELYVCGRAKDVVIIRGANHAPQLFEEALEPVEGVRTGCAVALGYTPPELDGEALLILAERSTADADAETDRALAERIRAAVLAHTQIRPHAVEVLAPGTLPRTSSGKLRRAEALRRYLAGELAPPKAVSVLTVATEVAKSTLALARSKRTP